MGEAHADDRNNKAAVSSEKKDPYDVKFNHIRSHTHLLEVAPHGHLVIWIYARQDLLRVYTSRSDQLLRDGCDLGGRGALDGLSLKGLDDVAEHLVGVGEDCGVLPGIMLACHTKRT